MTASGHLTIWMHLRNAQQVIAGLRATAAQTGLLGNATNRLAMQMERAGRRTFLMNQALFTLRRYSYMATLALTAGVVAVTRWGFQYLSQVQEARIAFQKFGLTQREVNKEIKDLYRIAAISPFLFTDITASARKFMAFGISVDMTNSLIKNLTDSLTAMGFATGAALNRATNAIVHMYALGHVTGQLVTQLTRDNIPIVQALEKELGITADQLHNISALGIPSAVAIQALNKYISETPRFHNAALIFATRTWRGIVTTTRDYMAQFIGTVEEPLFLKMQKSARRFLFWLTGQASRGFAKGGIAGMLGTFSPAAARFWTMLATALTAVWRIFVGGVIPAFQYMAQIILPLLYLALVPTVKILQFLGQHAWITRIFFALLAAELGIMAIRLAILLPLQAALITRMIVINTLQRIGILLGLRQLIVQRAQNGQMIASTLIYTRFGAIMRALVLLQFRQAAALLLTSKMWRLWTVLSAGAIRGAGGQFVAMTRLEKAVLRLRIGFLALARGVRAFSLAMLTTARSTAVFLLTNPVGWAILLAAILIPLYFRLQTFQNLLNRFFVFLRDHKYAVAAALTIMFGPIGLAAGMVLILWNRLRGLAAWIAKHRHDLPFNLGKPGGFGFHNPFSGLHIPGLASGGTVRSGGLALVGESGPEVLSLPKGAAVSPIGNTLGSLADLSHLEVVLYSRTVLEVDGRQMAETVAKHNLTAQARS